MSTRVAHRPKVVLLGMMTKMPVGGVTWLVVQYAIGLRRLGFDVYYVEAHARTPSMFMEHADDDPTAKAAAFLRTELGRFGFGDKWAFHALHDDGACYGMSWAELKRLYADAALIVNMHGGTMPLEEHAATGRLLYLGTDPGEVEFEIDRDDERAIAALELHTWFFTWGLNYGNPDCGLPWSRRFSFVPTPPPVVMDMWQIGSPVGGSVMTTIGNWRQPWRNLTIDGEVYRWSKHHEFLKIVELPERVEQRFELALGSYEPDDQKLLESHGWMVRPASTVSLDSGAYREYIVGSRGELTAAKDQNIRFRSGWFSERSATYLAAGRPVVMQDTAFGNHLPTGAGLLPFTDLDSAVDAIARVNADYPRHCAAAAEIAREFFDAEVVLRAMLARCGIEPPVRRAARAPALALPGSLDLTPRTRRPLRLADATTDAALRRPIPSVDVASPPSASIVMVTYGDLAVSRLAIESVLAHTGDVPYELIVVDNASDENTERYLGGLASRNRHIRVITNPVNRGFAAAVNQGLAQARGSHVAIVNNDVIVTPGWLGRLLAHLAAPGVGAVGPVTNRCGNEAEIPTSYGTYAEMQAFAAERAGSHARESTDVPMLVMFCVVMPRNVVDAVGPLDERFEIGMFEDDDYARRIRSAGMRLVCADDVFVHHFGEASFSALYASGQRSELFAANRERFERKWGVVWSPHARRADAAYDDVVDDVREVVRSLTAAGDVVAVVSKGDERMVDVAPGRACHFPAADDGAFAGHYPADDADAIRVLGLSEAAGVTHLVFPNTSFWWLSHYAGLRAYIDAHYHPIPLSTTSVRAYARHACTADDPSQGGKAHDDDLAHTS